MLTNSARCGAIESCDDIIILRGICCNVSERKLRLCLSKPCRCLRFPKLRELQRDCVRRHVRLWIRPEKIKVTNVGVDGMKESGDLLVGSLSFILQTYYDTEHFRVPPKHPLLTTPSALVTLVTPQPLTRCVSMQITVQLISVTQCHSLW